jgi:hypothetical protein
MLESAASSVEPAWSCAAPAARVRGAAGAALSRLVPDRADVPVADREAHDAGVAEPGHAEAAPSRVVAGRAREAPGAAGEVLDSLDRELVGPAVD